MSHYCVIVTGPDVERQLEPFDENRPKPVVKEIDSTDHYRKRYEEYLSNGQGNNKVALTFLAFVKDYTGSKVVAEGKPHKGNCIIVDKNKEVVKVIEKTYPNAKWDWFVVGGRWSGYFRVKPGAAGEFGERSWTNKDEVYDFNYADIILKKDIDIEGMQREARDRACTSWDKINEALGTVGLTLNENAWIPWRTVAQDCKGEIELARKVYQAQKAITALNEKLSSFMIFGADDFLCSRESYAKRHQDKALVPFAYLHQGQWNEKGEMGWFGMTRNEKDEQDWNKQFWDWFNALPDETLLTTVDCHI